MNVFSLWDFVLLPVFLVIVFAVSYKIKSDHIDSHPEYKYFTSGLFLKIFGGICLGLIYVFYYDGGDTIAYYQSSVAMINMLFKYPSVYLSILVGNLSGDNYYQFDNSTGFPMFYMYKDFQTFSVVRFVSLITLFGFKQYMLTSILVSCITYSGVWRLYLCFCDQYPEYRRELAIAVLFIPSVIFWGSGILKDSFTLSAAAWLVYCVYELFIKKRKYLFHSIAAGISIYVLICIKPYIFFAILMGILVWIFFIFLNKIESLFLKIVILPVLIIIISVFANFLTIQLGSLIGGHYQSINTMIEQASVIQDDLTREVYGGNQFDIGKFDSNLWNVFLKAPKAILAGLYRPFLWEANNILMIFSGIENFILLLLSFYLIIKVRLNYLFKAMISNAMVMFSFVYALFFAFAIGLSSANFGALVRYKIPLLPFFVAGLFIVIKNYRKEKTMESDSSLKIV